MPPTMRIGILASLHPPGIAWLLSLTWRRPLPSFTVPQVLDLTPDASSRKAGEALGRLTAWLAVGQDGQHAWGEIKGSGAAPYRTAVTVEGPVFRCTCPSRKFPCKHGLGLLLILAVTGAVPQAPPPDWVVEWAAKRAAGPKAAANPAKPVDAKAQDRRRQNRDAKVADGVEELDLWLCDLVRRGLASARGENYAFWDRMAARLVDAQAPGLARWVRALSGLLTSDEDAVLALGRLALLVAAWRRQDTLDASLRAEVRAAVGIPVPVEDLAALPGVEGHWTVLAQTVADEDVLRVRATWLASSAGRVAQVLDFAAGDRAFPPAPAPGHAFRGAVAFHPGASGLRAVLRGGEPADPQPIAGAGSVTAALDGVADALGRVPWLDQWPMLLGGVRFARRSAGFAVMDATGVLPLIGGDAVLPFLSVAGGHAADVFGLWSGRALHPLALGVAGRLHAAPADTRLLRRVA